MAITVNYFLNTSDFDTATGLFTDSALTICAPDGWLKSGRYTSVYPLSEHGAWKKNASAIRHLSELNSRIKQLEVLLSKVSSEGDSQ